MRNRGIGAGGSSQRKYDELTRSWRRRNRKAFLIVALICGSVLLLSFVAARLWPAYGWILGVFGGGALAFWEIVRLSPPGWVENWQSGALGEQATAKVLHPLESEGWVVLHDLPDGQRNIDHIAVGPGGVFLLDSKRLSGLVHVDAQEVMVHRFDDPSLTYRHPGAGHLRALARETHDRVLATRRLRTWVTPVMVLWSDFPQRVVAEGRCVYVHGDELVAWLRSRPQRIAPSRVQQVADAVREAWESQPASV